MKNQEFIENKKNWTYKEFKEKISLHIAYQLSFHSSGEQIENLSNQLIKWIKQVQNNELIIKD